MKDSDLAKLTELAPSAEDGVTPRQDTLVDLPTAILFVLVVFAPVLLAWAQAQGVLSALWSCVLATFAMNLSFTVWHEAAHGNFSRHKALNTLIGVLSSFASVYPGYFARRREHMAHHRWEGVDGMDPVYQRLQNTNLWLFPFHLFYIDFIKRQPLGVPPTFLPITSAQRIADWGSNLLAILVIAACWLNGLSREILAVWVIPRALIFWIHAYYICFFPHFRPEGGFEKYRTVSENPILRILTMGQTYHGIHHRWPFIPWHDYRDVALSAPGRALFQSARTSARPEETK